MAVPTRIVFMGTPDFAAPSLQALHASGPTHGWEVVAVVTQPDRPAGRGKQVTAGPVKALAQRLGVPVMQPATLRKAPVAVAELLALAPDLLVVAAYGLILPRRVLEIPTFGCINVHASLLPAYRGASPISAAILDGLESTGVSIMLMDEGMDTGPVLTQASQPIHASDTTATLTARLAQQGATLLVETLPGWLSGELSPIPQAELPGTPSVCRLIKKEAGLIDWRLPAVTIERMTRAYTPWPSAYTLWKGAPFKILQAEVIAGTDEPGVIVATSAGPTVGTGAGSLRLLRVQPAGKREMEAKQWLNGAPDADGARFGA